MDNLYGHGMMKSWCNSRFRKLHAVSRIIGTFLSKGQPLPSKQPHYSSSRFSVWNFGQHKTRINQFNMSKKGKIKGSEKTAKQKVPSSMNLVMVGTGGPGTSRCLLLTTEQSRYMFNCGEGSQRLTVMNKCLRSSANAKISGVDNIFITNKNWENTGGLLGIAMLVEGQKNPETKRHFKNEKQTTGVDQTSKTDEALPELYLYGPDGIEKLTMMARKFAERSNMNIVKKDGSFEDVAIKITPIPLMKLQSQADNGTNAQAKACTGEGSKEQVYAYLCNAKPAPPKINVAKCVDAGITMGPMVGELQRGNSVTLPDGTVVLPEQVTDMPPGRQNSFLVFECPSLDYFHALESNEVFNAYRGKGKKESLAIIVHMTPSTVFSNQVYKEWMQSFGEDTDHLVMNEDSSPASLSRVHTHQAQLNVVHSQVFPLLPQVEQKETGDLSQSGPCGGHVRKACSGLVYTLRGKSPGFYVETDDIDVETLQKDVLEYPDVREELEKLNKGIESAPAGNHYPKVVFLGTGSSEPNRIRAQSCISVHLSENSMMLLDCGEDSYGQFFRFYGKDEASRALLKMKAIFISHMHGDHHLGLLTLLKERRKSFSTHCVPFEPVILMAPIQMKRWLKFYHIEVEQIFHLFRFHKHQRDLKEFEDSLMMNVATDDDIRNTLGFTDYSTVEVIHARNSFGVTFTQQSGFKLVYSGDTRPCDRLVQVGQGCDLLIHEATHEDDLILNAEASKHSTFSEAMDIGKQMKAKQIILTHFSQRYPHMVPFYGTSVPSNVGVAFDNMQVTPETLPLLSRFIPPLTHIFDDKLRRLEIQSLKRNREQANLDDDL